MASSESHTPDPDSTCQDLNFAHLRNVDPSLLTVCLAQLSGDLDALERYGPKIEVYKPPFLPVAHMTLREPFHSALVREVAEQLELRKGEAELDFKDLDEETVGRMADVINGSVVDRKYIPMLSEQSGFLKDTLNTEREQVPDDSHEIAIIGAGMTGIASAVMAHSRGYRYTIFESTSDVGGIWNLNDYPGVAVDTPSVAYSLSFKVKSDWSNYYPQGEEYRAYLKDVANTFGVVEHVKFNTTVHSMVWEEDVQKWRILVRGADGSLTEHHASSVITALGNLNRPKYPDLKGQDIFRGASFHANRWDHSVSLNGKKVGIIGAGATSVQVVAEIAKSVEHLTVFQRQPHWIMPNMAGSGVVDNDRRWALENIPNYMKWDRFRQLWLWGDVPHYEGFRVDSEWAANHLSISQRNDVMMQLCLEHIERCFGSDSDLAQKVTPNYAPGGKRPVRDPGDFAPGGYYYALSQDNVDVETQEIARVLPEGVELHDGSIIELDVLIYSTGMTVDFLSTIDITGRDGVTLQEFWKGRPHTYLGGTVPGFPNFYMNCGPNTGVGHAGGHNFMAETVNHFIFECLQVLTNTAADSIEVTHEAEKKYDDLLLQTMQGSIWRHQTGAHTYYKNANGDVLFPTPFRHVDYWLMSRAADPKNFIVRHRTSDASAEKLHKKQSNLITNENALKRITSNNSSIENTSHDTIGNGSTLKRPAANNAGASEVPV